MIIECYGYYDTDEGRTKCIAEKGSHESCKKYMPCSNGRPCGCYRPDLNGGCDNASIQFEAYSAAIKIETEVK
jgi:hypothetical protein